MTILVSGGAGDAPAGEAPAGHDAPVEPDAADSVVPIAAILFDPETRTYPFADDGGLRATTEMMHEVAHRMVPLGSLPSSPKVGVDVDRIKRASEDQRVAVITNELRRSCQDLIDAGRIDIRNIILEPGHPWSGRWYADVADLTRKGRDFKVPEQR